MALNNTDLFIIQRGGVQYKMTADEISIFVGAAGKVSVADIAARDALTVADVQVGFEVFVVDGSADPTVDAGWAKYRVDTVTPSITFIKLQEQENLDVVIVSASNLSYTASPTAGTINNDNGTGVAIPVVDITNAGLATPTMLTNSHVAASAGLTSLTNPVVVGAGSQEVTFNISQLADLP